MNNRLLDLLIEFDEMGYAPTQPCGDPERCAEEWKNRVWEEVKSLEAENAELRERLEKAVELPCKVGDNVFCIVGIDPAVEEFEVEEILIKRLDPIFAVFRLRGIDIGVKTSCVLSQFGKRWFTELEDAEARLAELKGEKL